MRSPFRHWQRFAFALPLCGIHLSTFLPPVPRRRFASSASRGSFFFSSSSSFPRCGTMKALTPTPLTYGAGLPAYLATPSCRSVSNHVDCRVIAYHHASVTRGFRTSPCMSRLVAVPRRIEFVILRTDSSPPVALHLASRRRSYLRLRSLWLPPTRTFTVLMRRPHGRTHSRARGNPGLIVTPVKTGVHPHPLNLDTVFQRYDGRCPSPGCRPEFILSYVDGPA